MLINIIAWIILGALAGWVASLIMGTDAQQGAIANIVIGIIGAFIGGLIMSFIPGLSGADGLNIWSFLVALLGAVILIAILRAIRRR